MKRGIEKEFESCYNSALLLSLRGVNTIVLHQYAISPIVNAAEFHAVWEGIRHIYTNIHIIDIHIYREWC